MAIERPAAPGAPGPAERGGALRRLAMPPVPEPDAGAAARSVPGGVPRVVEHPARRLDLQYSRTGRHMSSSTADRSKPSGAGRLDDA